MWMASSWFFPGSIFWFTFGIVAGFHLKGLKQFLARVQWGLLAVMVISFLLGMLEWEILLGYSGQEWAATRITILDSFYAASFILVFLAFEKVPIVGSKQINDLGTKSFGVYLIHDPSMEITARVIYHFLPWALAYPLLLFQPILIVFGLGIPLLLMVAVKRSPAHRLYPYLFG